MQISFHYRNHRTWHLVVTLKNIEVSFGAKDLEEKRAMHSLYRSLIR